MPAKFESVPPVTMTSATVKSLEASLSLKVISDVVPAFSVCRLLVTATVGGFMSRVIDGESLPSTLALPTASVKFPAATVTVPSPVKPALGVNVAV